MTFYETEDDLPPLPKPILFTPGINSNIGKVAARKKSFLGIKYKKTTNFINIFEKPSKKWLYIEEERKQPERRAEPQSIMEPIKNTYDVKDVIAQAREKVAERGDKLENLERKFADMSERAKQFSEAATELRKQQEKKSGKSLWPF